MSTSPRKALSLDFQLQLDVDLAAWELNYGTNLASSREVENLRESLKELVADYFERTGNIARVAIA